LVRVFVSQGISSLAVEKRTLPQYFEHGESGVTKMDAASGADTTVATARRAAVIRIVKGFDLSYNQIWGCCLDLMEGSGSAELVNPGRRSPSCGRRCGGAALQLRDTIIAAQISCTTCRWYVFAEFPRVPESG
jgi:hypothetical protein